VNLVCSFFVFQKIGSSSNLQKNNYIQKVRATIYHKYEKTGDVPRDCLKATFAKNIWEKGIHFNITRKFSTNISTISLQSGSILSDIFTGKFRRLTNHLP